MTKSEIKKNAETQLHLLKETKKVFISWDDDVSVIDIRIKEIEKELKTLHKL